MSNGCIIKHTMQMNQMTFEQKITYQLLMTDTAKASHIPEMPVSTECIEVGNILKTMLKDGELTKFYLDDSGSIVAA